MEQRIVKFIAALRASGVRVSLAESADAFLAVDKLGVKNRESFRLSLRSTLIKDSGDFPVFEELFPLFFESQASPPMMDLSEDLTPEEARMVAEALRKFSERLRDMMGRMLGGEQLSQEELEQLGEITGLQHASDMRYREWMARRIEKALKYPEVREALEELMAILEQMGMDRDRLDQIQQIVQANQMAMEEQLRQFAGQKIAENLSEERPDEGVEGLMNRPFSTLTEDDLQRLRKEVSRLAALLRTRIALRQKRAKTGQLDAKATIRANLKHGSVPFNIKHRDRYLKPKLVVICDISTSMRPVSELMLSLLYALQDQVRKTHAFAFIDHLEYISPDFAGRDISSAVSRVLERMPPGHYNTDLGYSLANFSDGFMDTLDNRTTFILVGDGRNNYRDPGLNYFQQIARRSNRSILITPEPPVMWGTGDSDIYKYIPHCDSVLQVGNLNELTQAIDKLLV
jgi:uncharacterized protein with von Willebrand factor type A (vWA) domain